MATELTSAEAADRLGVTVQTWHRYAKAANLTPAHKMPGVRGACLWHPADVDRIARHLNERKSA